MNVEYFMKTQLLLLYFDLFVENLSIYQLSQGLIAESLDNASDSILLIAFDTCGNFLKKLMKSFSSMNLFCWVNLSIGMQFTFKMKFYRRNVCFQRIKSWLPVYRFALLCSQFENNIEFRIITDS